MKSGHRYSMVILRKALFPLIFCCVWVAAALWYALSAPGQSFHGPLPALTSEEADLATRLRTHVEAIASTPHNTRHYQELEAAAQYIEATLGKLGYTPQRQVYDADSHQVRNIWVTIEPSKVSTSTETLIVGAHYDSAFDAPGANDNGTGTAAVLELARTLNSHRLSKHRLILVLFVNEEPPYFMTPLMGSEKFAALLTERREPIAGMISLETIGAFSDTPGSQRYPPLLRSVYPDTGNFLAFVGLPGSKSFLNQVLASFRSHTDFPTQSAVVPASFQGADWSDHASFAGRGIPALMITDTATYRYQHYHKVTDTPDKVDFEKLARITLGIDRTLKAISP
jgi:hypothetical protein